MNNVITGKLREFITTHLWFTEPADFPADDASLLEAGMVDSLGVMELVEYVQREFGFEVPTREITAEDFDSIQRLADYIRGRQSLGQFGESAEYEGNRNL